MEAELPVLQRLKRNGDIQKILVYRFVSGVWKEPREIGEDSFDVPIYRRRWHPMDSFESKKICPSRDDTSRMGRVAKRAAKKYLFLAESQENILNILKA